MTPDTSYLGKYDALVHPVQVVLYAQYEPRPLKEQEWNLPITPYLEGHGDFVSRLIIGIPGDTIWLMGVINLRTKSHYPPSRVWWLGSIVQGI